MKVTWRMLGDSDWRWVVPAERWERRLVPTEEDWRFDVIPDDMFYLDVNYARERFMGKSIDETQEFFKGSALCVCEDLANMPPVPFRYYIFSITKYLTSATEMDEATRDNGEFPDAASCFLNLLERQLACHSDYILPVMDELLPVAEFVAANQSLYNASIDTYGSFPVKLKAIWKIYAEKRGSLGSLD